MNAAGSTGRRTKRCEDPSHAANHGCGPTRDPTARDEVHEVKVNKSSTTCKVPAAKCPLRSENVGDGEKPVGHAVRVRRLTWGRGGGSPKMKLRHA
jgi:hypothetical protein